MIQKAPADSRTVFETERIVIDLLYFLVRAMERERINEECATFFTIPGPDSERGANAMFGPAASSSKSKKAKASVAHQNKVSHYRQCGREQRKPNHPQQPGGANPPHQ